jgi:hypothetical protein
MDNGSEKRSALPRQDEDKTNQSINLRPGRRTMARTHQTARKSTGGRAPRRKLLTTLRNVETQPVFKPSEEPQLDFVLGFAFSKKMADSVNDVSKLPVFDLDNSELVNEYLPGFTVCREPMILDDSMTNSEKKFLNKVIRGAKKDYPNSSYVVVMSHPVAEEDPDYLNFTKAFKPLPNILETGKLHGCELRGNWDTG